LYVKNTLIFNLNILLSYFNIKTGFAGLDADFLGFCMIPAERKLDMTGFTGFKD